MQGFTEEVCNHVLGRTVDQVDVSFLNTVLDKEVSDGNVTRLLASRLAAILFHLHCAHVVLVEIVFHFIPLCSKEVGCPDGCTDGSDVG